MFYHCVKKIVHAKKTCIIQWFIGCEIRCKHQIFLPAKPTIESLIEKIQIDNETNSKSISINSLIKVILEQKGFILQANFGIIPDIEKLFFSFIAQGCTLDEEDYVLLIKSIHKCFEYEIPPIPEFNQEFNIHEKEEFFCKDYIEIKPSRTNPPPPKEMSKEDEEFWTQNTGSPNHQRAKRAMFETINEIIHVYPCLQKTTIPYGICFDKYLTFLSDNTEDDILNWIPKFKIACWKATDIHMKNNKFFK